MFDAPTGNLSSRQNYLRGQTETFLYDNLDRLQTVTGPRNLSMTYYDNGNMKTKSDIDGSSSFVYGEGAGPHALTSLTCSSGLIPATEQHAVYNSSDKVTSLTQGGYAATFLYNADNQRSKMTVTENGSAVLTRWYAGSSYIREVCGTVTAEYTYLGGDVYSAPVMAVTQNGITNYYYLLRDYLGSVTHQVNTSNSVVEEYSFDAWGRRRNAADWTLETNDQSLNADRGFTGHEFLPYFSLYNMNGRLYDPLVGRFLSADPYIGDPASTQSYNRYSYALNNPLKYTDPSGYNYKPIYWDEAIGGSIPSIRTYGRFGSAGYGSPGYRQNGTGLNGVYYDWYSGTYRSTDPGNYEVGWGYANNVISQYSQSASALIYSGTRSNPYENFRGVHYANGSSWYLGEGFTPAGGGATNGGGNNWLSNVWNNSWLGKMIPDVIYINQSGVLNYVGGGGYSTGYALQLKGKEGVHLYSTLTLNLKAGLHGSVGVNVGYSSYVGDSRNFSFIESFAGTGTRGFDSDIIIGVGGSVSSPNRLGDRLYSYDIGAGPSVGASLNIGSYTYVHEIW